MRDFSQVKGGMAQVRTWPRPRPMVNTLVGFSVKHYRKNFRYRYTKYTEPAKGHGEKKIISCARDSISCAAHEIIFFSPCPIAGSVTKISRYLGPVIGTICKKS